MKHEISILKAFLVFEVWNTYNTYVQAKDFPEELQFLYRCLDSFHKTNTEEVDLHVLDLANLFFSQHKGDKAVSYTHLTLQPNREV